MATPDDDVVFRPTDPMIHDDASMRLQDLVNVHFHNESEMRLHFTPSIANYCGSVNFAFYITRNYIQSDLGMQEYELRISESAKKLVETLRHELREVKDQDYMIYLRAVIADDIDEDVSVFDIHCFIGEYTDQ